MFEHQFTKTKYVALHLSSLNYVKLARQYHLNYAAFDFNESLLRNGELKVH